MRKFLIIILVVCLLILSYALASAKTNLQGEINYWESKCSDLEDDITYWKSECEELDNELNGPRALVEVREMHFEWNKDKGKIVGEVKNIGSADAIEVHIRIMEYNGKYGERFGSFCWIDYLREGENKPFELEVNKPYCDNEYIPQVELGYKTVGKYSYEYRSRIMHL